MEIGPLSYVVVGLVSFFVSGLTLFVGFGLGTLLLPVFALFFPIDVAVAATAVVHLANNLFKVGLMYRDAVPRVLLRFGLPAVALAFAGALLLRTLSQQDPLFEWVALGRTAVVTPIELVMGLLIVLFALSDLSPAMGRLRFDTRWLPVGGALSGFFGGLSGHQGALRAAFLLPLGLTPTAFAATQAVIASMVDLSRLSIYGSAYLSGKMQGVTTREQWSLVFCSTLCAFAGAYLGRKMLKKVTMQSLRLLAGALLLVVGSLLAMGII